MTLLRTPWMGEGNRLRSMYMSEWVHTYMLHTYVVNRPNSYCTVCPYDKVLLVSNSGYKLNILVLISCSEWTGPNQLSSAKLWGICFKQRSFGNFTLKRWNAISPSRSSYGGKYYLYMQWTYRVQLVSCVVIFYLRTLRSICLWIL